MADCMADIIISAEEAKSEWNVLTNFIDFYGWSIKKSSK